MKIILVIIIPCLLLIIKSSPIPALIDDSAIILDVAGKIIDPPEVQKCLLEQGQCIDTMTGGVIIEETDLSRRKSWTAVEDTKQKVNRDRDRERERNKTGKESNMSNSSGLKHSTSSVSAFMNRLNSSYNNHSNQTNMDDKDGDNEYYSEEVAIEFNAKDLPTIVSDLKFDPELNLLDNEPESWTQSVPKEVVRSVKDKKALKRQEQIFEFILNEKRNYIILLIMQNLFAEGLDRYFHFEQSTLDRLFPRLNDLIAIHAEFLKKLRKRQRENYFVDSIADILLTDFFEANSNRLKSVYGEFCTQHKDSVDLYKNYSKPNSDFKRFEEFCKNSPLLKKRGMYECILHVSLILTKYPLLIQPMIETSEDPAETSLLQKSLKLSQEIVTHVDSTMAKKQREERKLQIYEKIEEKSFALYRGKKFKRSDLLNADRLLLFEGTAHFVLSNRTKLVTVIVLTDVIIFLYENSSQKFTFLKADNCPAVISLQKILVRKKANCKDKEPNTIFLVISNPLDPNMIELHVENPKELDTWDNSIRLAVINCPIDEDFLPTSDEDKAFMLKKNQVKNIIDQLRKKDLEMAIMLEEKMALQLRLLATLGVDPPVLSPYRDIVSENMDNSALNEIVLTTIHETSQFARSLNLPGPNLSRSASSVGEHQSGAFSSPTLPKRSETFAGFDNNAQNALKLLTKRFQTGFSTFADNVTEIFDNSIKAESNSNNDSSSSSPEANHSKKDDETSDLLQLDKEQQKVAVHVSHYVYTLVCVVTQLMTTNESLKAENTLIKTANANSNGDTRNHYRHNQQLEELRSLQDKITADKISLQKMFEQFQQERSAKEQYFERVKEQLALGNEDLQQQREQLFRQLEKVNNLGLLITPTPSNSSSTTSLSVGGSSTVEEKRPKLNSSGGSGDSSGRSGISKLPINLLSAANQQKVSAQNLPIKQQLPLKLANKISVGSKSGSGSGSKSDSGSSSAVHQKRSDGYQKLANSNKD